MDSDRNGEISFDEFYDVMTGRLDLAAQVSAGITRSPSGRSIQMDSIDAQHMVAGSSRSIRDIKNIFNAIDEDNSGFLDRNEVRNVCRLPQANTHSLVLIFDMCFACSSQCCY